MSAEDPGSAWMNVRTEADGVVNLAWLDSDEVTYALKVAASGLVSEARARLRDAWQMAALRPAVPVADCAGHRGCVADDIDGCLSIRCNAGERDV